MTLKKLFLVSILLMSIIIMFNSCKEPQNEKKAWTIIYYSDADNDLEGPLLDDIQEMKEGLQANADIYVIVLIDRTPGSSNNTTVFGEDFTDTRIYEILPDSYMRIDGRKQFPEITEKSNYEANMGDPETLQKFIQFCKATYPADNYALFLSNHGSGSRSIDPSGLDLIEKAICFDDSSGGDALYTAEITDVLTSAESVNFMAFDACLMATAEVAYQYRPGTADFSADYLLASAPNVWGAGFAYKAVFTRLNILGGDNGEADSILGGNEANINPTTMTAEDLGAVFLEEQKDDTLSAGSLGDAQSLTLMNLANASAVKTAVDTLAVSLAAEKADMETLRGSLAVTDVLEYFNEIDEGEWISSPYFDLYDLAEKISLSGSFSGTIQTNASAVMTAVDNFIVHSFGNSDFAGFIEGQSGVSIFFPDGDRLYSGDPQWGYQWWYNALNTASVLGPAFVYGKLAWCQDGLNAATLTVGNWFELMDSWFDVPQGTSPTGYNGYQW